MTTFAEAVEQIGTADSFAELGAGEAAYRKLAKLIHPDAVSDAQKPAATAAFARLAELWKTRALFYGDVADLHPQDGGRALLKVPREPADNDLMEAEAVALRRLERYGDPKYRPYAPKLLGSYTNEDDARVRKTVNVIEHLHGFVPLTAVHNLDPRDAAWMWRRLLVGLGWAHRAGVVHGAVLEEHVLIHPEQHGLALVDWCYSGATPRALVERHRAHYPPEVFHKEQGPATDIHMATSLMTRLIGDGMPAAMRRFADGCRFDRPRMRPQDAWQLLGELDELLDRLYGPRKFRAFVMGRK